MANGQITLSEIQSQPQIWAAALGIFERQANRIAAFWAEGGFDQVLFTGCGSTYYLGVTGAVQLQAAAKIPAKALSASELLLYPQANFGSSRKTLLICVSRSGTTRETLAAAQLFRQHGRGSIMVVTNHSESLLAAQADLLLAVDDGREVSRVQTRSFSSMAVIITALAALLGGRDWTALRSLPTALENLMQRSDDLMRQLGSDTSITQFAFLGSGAQYGMACEAMLKMTEMSRVFSVSYHTHEFLHGPRYAADAHTIAVGLVSESAYAEEVNALKPLPQRRTRVLALAEQDQGEGLSELDHSLLLESGIPEWGRTILYLPPLQMLCFHQAIQRGFDPDNLPFDPRDNS